MSMKRLLSALLLLSLLSSCKPGKWDDVIGLSTKTVEADAAGATINVLSQGGFTLMSLYVSDENGELVRADDNAGRRLDGAEWYLSGEWIEVIRVEYEGKVAMAINISPNDSGKTRKAQICVALGDYADYVNVTQSK